MARLYPTTAEHWVSAGDHVPGAVSTELGKKSRNDLRGVSGGSVYRTGGLRRSDSCDQGSYGNKVHGSFRYTANSVLR